MTSNLDVPGIALECNHLAAKLEFVTRFFVGDVVTPLAKLRPGSDIAATASKLFERVEAAHEIAARMEHRSYEAAAGGLDDITKLEADARVVRVKVAALKRSLERFVITPLSADPDAYDLTFEATGFAWSLKVAGQIATVIQEELRCV